MDNGSYKGRRDGPPERSEKRYVQRKRMNYNDTKMSNYGLLESSL